MWAEAATKEKAAARQRTDDARRIGVPRKSAGFTEQQQRSLCAGGGCFAPLALRTAKEDANSVGDDPSSHQSHTEEKAIHPQHAFLIAANYRKNQQQKRKETGHYRAGCSSRNAKRTR